MRSSRSKFIQTKNKSKKKTKEQKTKNKHKASCSSQSNAAHPVALTKAQQKVVDDIKKFGRLPKMNTGHSEEDKLEYKLYWRYYNHKKDLPESILQDLFLLHPVALTKAQQKVVDDIKKFGRLPKKNTGDSEEDKWEYKLYWRYYNHKKDLPENFLLQDKADALHNCNRQPLPDGVLLSMR